MATVTRPPEYPINPDRKFPADQKAVIAFEVWGPMNRDQIVEFNRRFEDLLKRNGEHIGVRIGSERAKMMTGDGPKKAVLPLPRR